MLKNTIGIMNFNFPERFCRPMGRVLTKPHRRLTRGVDHSEC